MRLTRAAYHSGALIGPDVNKLVTKQNIRKFSAISKPMEVNIHSKMTLPLPSRLFDQESATSDIEGEAEGENKKRTMMEERPETRNTRSQKKGK